MSKKLIIKSAIWIGLFALVGKLSGILREITIAAAFGTTGDTDAYFMGLTITDFLREITAGGVLSAVFIPAYSAVLAKSDGNPLIHKNFFRSSFAIVLTILIIAMIFNALAAPLLIKITAPGIIPSSEIISKAIAMMRIMSPAILFMGIASFIGGALNTHKHFIAPASFQLFLNAGIIAGATVMSKLWGVYSLALGFLLGAFLQLSLSLISSYSYGILEKPSPTAQGETLLELKKLLSVWWPLFIVSILSTANDIVSRSLASYLEAGNIAAVSFANRIRETVWLFCAAPMGVAVFPYLSDEAAKGEEKSVAELTNMALRLTTLMAAPLAAYVITMGGPLVKIIFERGRFDTHSTFLTSTALIFYAPSAMFYALNYVLLKTYYSLGKSKAQLKIFSIAFAINILLGAISLKHYGIGGITLARSATDIITFLLLLSGISQLLAFHNAAAGKILTDMLKISASAFIAAWLSRFLHSYSSFRGFVFISDNPDINAVLILAISIAVTIPLYFFLCHNILKIPETASIIRIVRAKLNI